MAGFAFARRAGTADLPPSAEHAKAPFRASEAKPALPAERSEGGLPELSEAGEALFVPLFSISCGTPGLAGFVYILRERD
jgi:hypothetical protein